MKFNTALVSIMVLFEVVNSAPVTDECPAPLPCTCRQRVILCANVGLTDVPKFKVTTGQYRQITLRNNDITTIQPGAFENIDASEHFIVDLESNKINNIQEGAFRGIAEKVKYLELSNNKLSELPKAFWDLNNLASLRLLDNPIKRVNSLEHSQINLLDFDTQELYTWPDLSGLIQADTLDLAFPVVSIPDDAFSAHGKLKSLTIKNGKFQKIPSSIGNLQRLQFLSLKNNPFLKVEDIPSTIFEGLADSLWALELAKVNMKVVPAVFRQLPRLNHLQLGQNPITHVDDSLVPENLPLRFLGLGSCNLERYPSAVSTMTSLQTLYMDNNDIATLETGDFQGLVKLRTLDLNNNPIFYLSPDVFTSLSSLKVLNLSNTKLTTVPRAILDLTTLRFLDLSTTMIKCTCEMDWLLEWSRLPSVDIVGDCVDVDSSISDYIKATLPSC